MRLLLCAVCALMLAACGASEDAVPESLPDCNGAETNAACETERGDSVWVCDADGVRQKRECGETRRCRTLEDGGADCVDARMGAPCSECRDGGEYECYQDVCLKTCDPLKAGFAPEQCPLNDIYCSQERRGTVDINVCRDRDFETVVPAPAPPG